MADDLECVVNTDSGPVKGIKRTAVFGDKYYSFQKIPYAKPPLAHLRFKSPEPIEPWTEVLDATVQGSACTQKNNIINMIMGQEDCLYINIFTKNVKPDKPYPVMLYIHGGAFMRGSSGTEIYGPDFLIQKEVILVSFNYRLGAFGFLSFKDPKLEVPGNAGLKDQTLALKWIKKNIKHFGGDPNNITLFGESAGGCSVHYQMICNNAKNLFNRAIVMSGTALNNWSIVPDRDWARRLATTMGWNPETNGDSEKSILDFLRIQEHKKIAKAQDTLINDEDKKDRILFPFGPIIEPYNGPDCMIPSNPKDMCRRAWSRSMPIMIGGTSEEGLFSYNEAKTNPALLSTLKDDFARIVPIELQYEGDGKKRKAFGEKLRETYFQDREPSFENVSDYVTMMTDKLFWHGVHRSILSRMSSLERGLTYVYRFSFDSEYFNHYRMIMCGEGVRGVCHADDLSYLFKNAFGDKFPEEGSKEYITIQRMVDFWTSFAITGDPNPKDSTYVKNIKWEPLKEIAKGKPYKVLNVSEKVEIVDLPETKRMALWDSMYENDQLY